MLSRQLSLQWLLSSHGPLSRISKMSDWRIFFECSGWKRWSRRSWGAYAVSLISSVSEQHQTRISSKAGYQCTVCSFWAGSLFVIVNLYCCTTQKSKQRAFARVMTLWRKKHIKAGVYCEGFKNRYSIQYFLCLALLTETEAAIIAAWLETTLRYVHTLKGLLSTNSSFRATDSSWKLCKGLLFVTFVWLLRL